MNSLFSLLKTNRKFLFYVLIFIAFLVWAWIKGFKILAVVMLLLVLGAAIINLWKTKS